jgi:hypothetical protein
MKLSSDMMLANFQAQRVIGLRLAKLAKGGPAAEAESRRMVTEKLMAAAQTGAALASGQSAHAIVRKYRAIMHANERRLTRQK